MGKGLTSSNKFLKNLLNKWRFRKLLQAAWGELPGAGGGSAAMGSGSVGSVALWKPPLGVEGDLKAFSELPEEPERGGLAQGGLCRARGAGGRRELEQ